MLHMNYNLSSSTVIVDGDFEKKNEKINDKKTTAKRNKPSSNRQEHFYLYRYEKEKVKKKFLDCLQGAVGYD